MVFSNNRQLSGAACARSGSDFEKVITIITQASIFCQKGGGVKGCQKLFRKLIILVQWGFPNQSCWSVGSRQNRMHARKLKTVAQLLFADSTNTRIQTGLTGHSLCAECSVCSQPSLHSLHKGHSSSDTEHCTKFYTLEILPKWEAIL